VERIRPVSSALLRRLATDAEWERAGGREPETAVRLFSAKEAVLKAVGAGLAGLAKCGLEGRGPEGNTLLLSFAGRPYRVVQTFLKDAVVSVALDAHPGADVAWTVCCPWPDPGPGVRL
jgi:phosphopantetheinyl transferase (holo-ACP synthase)